jgi:hypothetical protein
MNDTDHDTRNCIYCERQVNHVHEGKNRAADEIRQLKARLRYLEGWSAHQDEIVEEQEPVVEAAIAYVQAVEAGKVGLMEEIRELHEAVNTLLAKVNGEVTV